MYSMLATPHDERIVRTTNSHILEKKRTFVNKMRSVSLVLFNNSLYFSCQ
jgi:hypothetical protein